MVKRLRASSRCCGDAVACGRNESGASILIALAFMLIACMIAVVAVSAAGVNADRASAANRSDDQGYYAVTSALYAAATLVKRDVCGGAASVIDDELDGIRIDYPASDELELGKWAAEQKQRVLEGKKATPKHVVVSAENMGDVDVKPVLLTFTYTGNEITVQACIDVWGDTDPPTDQKQLKADLVKDGVYASILSKRLASESVASATETIEVEGDDGESETIVKEVTTYTFEYVGGAS